MSKIALGIDEGEVKIKSWKNKNDNNNDHEKRDEWKKRKKLSNEKSKNENNPNVQCSNCTGNHNSDYNKSRKMICNGQSTKNIDH